MGGDTGMKQKKTKAAKVGTKSEPLTFAVYVYGRSAPMMTHDNIFSAMTEAERLARKENTPVHVLKTVAVCKPQPMPVKWAEYR